MRIVDFKELLTLPPRTLFSIVDCKAARHSALVKDAYTKLPMGSTGLSFHGDKVNPLEGYELALPAVAKAYVRNESLSLPATRQQREFVFADFSTTQFAVWEKTEIEELLETLKRALAVFPDPLVVSN